MRSDRKNSPRRAIVAIGAAFITLVVGACDRGGTALGPDQTLPTSPSFDQTAPVPPFTLTGEILRNDLSNGTFRQIGDCRTDEFVTILFSFRGTATGPYPGPFIEAGRLRLQFATFGSQRVGHVPASAPFLDAAFAIFSPTTHAVVSGTKTATTGDGRSLCVEGVVSFFDVSSFELTADARYSAVIGTSSGRFHDEGTAPLRFVAAGVSGQMRFLEAVETFTSSLSAPIPIGRGDD